MNFDLQSIEINVNSDIVFDFIANPKNLPLWSNNYIMANQISAIKQIPNGQLKVELETIISKNKGTIDWIITMSDGRKEWAYSRVNQNGKNSIYSFILLTQPIASELSETTLDAQKLRLAQDLKILKNVLETLVKYEVKGYF